MAMNLTTNAKSLQDTLTAAAHVEQPQTKEGSIDLTLPITSTYLKRMKALGLSGGYENLYGQNNALFKVSTLRFQVFNIT